MFSIVLLYMFFIVLLCMFSIVLLCMFSIVLLFETAKVVKISKLEGLLVTKTVPSEVFMLQRN